MKILIIDDHLIFLQGAAAILSEVVEDANVLTASNHETALCYLNDHPDIELIFMDLNMPDSDGLKQFDILRREHPLVPIAMLSATENIQMIRRCLDAGAMGFISKTNDAADILTAIETIMQGGIYIPQTTQTALRKLEFSQSESMPKLTSRQLEVLKHINDGKSNRKIAQTLNITENTVKAHVMAIYRVFHVDSRVNCLKKAREFQFI